MTDLQVTAEDLALVAAAESRLEAVEALLARGRSKRYAAAALGVSPSRVSRILRPQVGTLVRCTRCPWRGHRTAWVERPCPRCRGPVETPQDSSELVQVVVEIEPDVVAQLRRTYGRRYARCAGVLLRDAMREAYGVLRKS